MADLMSGSSGYQTGSIDTATAQTNNVSPHNANHINGVARGVIQVETILGDGPSLKGTLADLVARLAVALANTGVLNAGLLITTPTINSPAVNTPTITTPVISGTITGTYTLGGTPTVPASAGSSLVLIETLDLATDDIVNNLGSVYDEHLFELINVRPVIDSADLFLTYSDDNGATFANSGYEATLFGVADATTTAARLALNVSNLAARGGVNGWVYVHKPQLTAVTKQCHFSLSYVSSAANLKDVHGACRCTDTSPDVVANAVNAIKITYNSGVAEGTLRHYGVKNT